VARERGLTSTIMALTASGWRSVSRRFDCTRFEYDGSPPGEAQDRRDPPDHQQRLV